jgi:hypothetical protein
LKKALAASLYILSAVSVVGCAGKLEYVRPTTSQAGSQNAVIIEKPRDVVWNTSVPRLGKQFFVINNLDKSSGLINVSYTGDPEQYIDCGRIKSFVQNAAGTRNYDFPAARAQQNYEVLDPAVGLFNIERRMSLDGRVNLIFEEMGPKQTRATANTRYVVTRQVTTVNTANGFPTSSTDTISFNSGGSASLPANGKGVQVECVSTGKLERDILDAVNGQ